MPKIIKNLKPKIIEAAIKIFNEEGFNAIDMRRIALECHIAVGTLYNYFPNKKKLMFKVFNNLWIESIDILNEIIDNGDPQEGLLAKYITALQKEKDKKKGIGRQLFRLELIETTEDELNSKAFFTNTEFHIIHRKQIRKVLQKSFNLNDEQIEGKSFDKLTNTCMYLVMSNKPFEEDYVIFLCDLISSYIKLNIK
ncbi:TetR/AcrR family transcriptional regulator [Abyssisolibacter fermentans]|uniref:TetR/AcrR family transcriptional regulator n=1 Tax=Abyssisolibacter fermentans TaxID=1766203 RepID=UPI0008317620|nr:TetR/AcrR family transcriptional regulator [Abyssisolibacter fermentans]